MTERPDRRERLLNVLAYLLESPAGLTREEIVGEPTLGYPATPVAARKAFERDKESLRALGVPLSQEGSDADYRYRVVPDEYYLPDLGLTDSEAAALHVAVSAVSLGGGAGEGALMKLGALEAEGAAPVISLPLDPALAPLFEASRRRATVTFTYRGTARHVEPWGLSSKWGNWYMVGHDRDRGQVRVFRADRIDGDVELGPDDQFTIAAAFRPEDHLEDQPWQFGTGTTVRAELAADAQHAARVVAEAGEPAVARWQPDGSVVLELEVANREAFRSFVLGFLDHVEVRAPADLRADIVAWLESIAARAAP